MTKKNKKNIKQFKEALLSNTDFINPETESSNNDGLNSLIESDTLEKFELLANFEKTETKDLINKALNHFLKLKGLQLEQALKAKNNQ